MKALITAVLLAAGLYIGLQVHNHDATVSTSSTPAPATVTTNAGGQAVYTYQMPASSTPTRCSVWDQGHDAEVLFASNSVQVGPACDSWVQSSAAGGELWIKDEVADTPADVEQTTCSLTSPTGAATAIVKDEAGGGVGQDACTRLIAAGTWTENP